MSKLYCTCWLCTSTKKKVLAERHDRKVKTGLRQISAKEIESNRVSAYKYLLP